MRLFRCALALGCGLLSAGPGRGQTPNGVTVSTLKNGMKILAQEDHGIPTVALYLFFRVGSRDERPGITGLSHFFEHMMFNGSEHYGAGEFDRQMELKGGSNNAYTTKDTTVYTDWFPPPALPLMLDMEADRMQHLTLAPKLVASEREVVYSERRLRVDNDNTGALFEQITSAAFTAHPYHWPVIGWPSDIEAWTKEDLDTYYREGYAPNNCVMVAVGDFSTKQLIEMTEAKFGAIPSHETFAEPRTKEPEQKGERVVHVRKESELPLLGMSFHMPESRSADNSAIQLLEIILSTGDSSRLYQRLVNQEQVALNASAFDEPSIDPYLVGLLVQPRAGVEVEKVRAITEDELTKISSAPVSEAELRKAKNQWLAGHYRELKTVAGRANQLGSYEVFMGGYARLYSEPADIETVTAADVQRVAKQIFRAENRTVGILDPETSAPPTATAQKGSR